MREEGSRSGEQRDSQKTAALAAPILADNIAAESFTLCDQGGDRMLQGVSPVEQEEVLFSVRSLRDVCER